MVPSNDPMPALTQSPSEPAIAAVAALDSELAELVDRMEGEMADVGIVTAESAHQLRALRLKAEAILSESDDQQT